MAPIKKTVKTVLILLLGFSLSRCANQLPPPGGEVDKTPPSIVELNPKDGTVNFKGNSIDITFSEYVNRRSVQDNIFISPKINGELDYSWSGRSLEITFPDSLKKNTTYSITVGAGAADLNNNNRMAEAFSFSFSTGSTIDSCKIAGKVYDKDPAGILIFAYKGKGDEINIAKAQPDYVSQVGRNGNYILKGLGYGNYSVFAIRDKMGDYVYDEGVDYIGMPFENVDLKRDSSSYGGLDFFLSVKDTIVPHISKVVMTDRNHIALEFSKAVDSTLIKPDNFYLIDSLTRKKTEMKYFYKGQGKPFQFFLSFADSINKSGSLFLTAENITDLNGNKLTSETASVVYNPRADTSTAKIIKLTGQYQGDLLDYETPQIYVQFDHAFPVSAPAEGISVTEGKDKVLKINTEPVDNSSFRINVTDKVKPKSELTVNIDLSKFKDVAGKGADSLYKKNFQVINDLDFSGTMGTVEADSVKDVYVVLEKSEGEKRTYRQKTDGKGNFEIKKVVPGKYLLWSFRDSDRNKAYSYGKLKPFTYSEKFKFYADTLNLRARWPVGDIKIQLDKK